MKKTITLKTKKYESEGDLAWQYNPLHNIIDTAHSHSALKDFDVPTTDLNLDMQHPVEVEIQPSYDGSVNLILNDDHDVPRIVNSAFSVKEGWKYEKVVRAQQKQTNHYSKDLVDAETRLFRTTSTFMQVDLLDVEGGGALKGGNYTFFFKYGDDDFNETDWVGESSLVSVFSGYASHISGIRGTMADEITDKLVLLGLSNIDVAFSKLYVYVLRNTSDLNGVKNSEAYKLAKPVLITGKDMTIVITGNEQTVSVSTDIFNVEHSVCDFVATSTQVQNRLFFGNVGMMYEEQTQLAQCALNIGVSCGVWDSESVGYVDCNYAPLTVESAEYYNPKNIYYRLGYWPLELYRLGVVFIYNNDTLSQTYNLKGCCFSEINDSNNVSATEFREYDLKELYIDYSSRYNTKGVFQMPDVKILGTGQVSPLGLKMEIPSTVTEKLRKLKVKGLMFVRQPRIPIALAQGLSIGISKRAYIPMLSMKQNDQVSYITESVLSGKTLRRNVLKSIDADGKEVWETSCSALLCQDVNLNPAMQSMLYGNKFVIKPYAEYNIASVDAYSRHYRTSITPIEESDWSTVELVYVNPDVGSRIINKNIFSTKSGSESELRTLRNLRWDSEYTVNDGRPVDQYTVRGQYTGFIGVLDKEIAPNTLYTIYTDAYIGDNDSKKRTQIEIRANDSTPFYKISQKIELPISGSYETRLFGGDCFTCTSTIKMCHNFLDHSTPLNDKIVKPDISSDVNMDYNKWEIKDLNLSDWNNVQIGHYITYKCMSNYNLGIRCIDDQRTDERALFGDVRSFYPFSQSTWGVSFKIPESALLNGGMSSVLSNKYYFESEIVPYVKKSFDNRICFSDMQHVDSFQNNYRVFSKLAYTDVERQYGAIIKLLPLGNNLFCVFEHGCGIIPVNEKALMSTTTGQSIHLYGSDVVQSQVTVISPHYGSTWEESIIETENAVYGVDTFAKKIWRYSSEGFSIISDMVVQKFLNDNINLTEYDTAAVVTFKNVKSHYNRYKGDIMFTFYNGDKEWNLCYNERLQKWTTRYSWTPGYSANIYNSYISTDKKRSSYYAKVDALVSTTKGITTESSPKFIYNPETSSVLSKGIYLNLVGYQNVENSEDADSVVHKLTLALKNIDIYCGENVDVISDIGTALPVYKEFRPREFNWDLSVLGKKVSGESIHISAPGFNIYGILNQDYDFSSWKTNYSVEDEEVNSAYDLVFKELVEYKNILKSYVKYPTNSEGGNVVLSFGCEKTSKLPFHIELDFDYVIYKTSTIDDEEVSTNVKTGILKLPIVLDSLGLTEQQRRQLEEDLTIKFYVHGKAGNYSEINYSDEDPTNQILPAKWYGRQEPFEFEFVVNQNVGMQKIFDNIAIISNNAEPDSMECTIIGDSYDFNKKGIFESQVFGEDEFKKHSTSQNLDILFALSATDNLRFTTTVRRDSTLNQYTLSVLSSLRDIANSKYGRRLGNITYLEDKWVISIDPIYYKNKYKTEVETTIVDNDDICLDDTCLDPNGKEYSDYSVTTVSSRQIKESSVCTTKLRDKWMKVRIKYKGDKLAVISAVQSLFTTSFA